MKIGELAELSGLPASTIRYWERAGILPAPSRVAGQRRYSKDAVGLLAILRLAQACGFTLAEMRQLQHGFAPGFKVSRRWQEMAKKKQTELDAQIQELQAMKKLVAVAERCGCADLAGCGRLAAAIMK